MFGNVPAPFTFGQASYTSIHLTDGFIFCAITTEKGSTPTLTIFQQYDDEPFKFNGSLTFQLEGVKSMTHVFKAPQSNILTTLVKHGDEVYTLTRDLEAMTIRKGAPKVKVPAREYETFTIMLEAAVKIMEPHEENNDMYDTVY